MDSAPLFTEKMCYIVFHYDSFCKFLMAKNNAGLRILQSGVLFHKPALISYVRYCTASAMWLGWIVSLPARSAIVRATRRILS